tara:strand:- start:281 stop:808 length:528 start_codon:yes stop_codon:yes gene_type:complete
MKKISLKSVIIYLFASFFFFINSYGDEKKKKVLDPHKYNFYTGMFDFSDDGKRSSIIGIQHQNENLFRETFLGTVSPVTGFMMTTDNATYLYTGIQADYNIGKMNFTPSFSPGLYGQGNGKDLGHVLEFKSELQLSLDLSKSSEFGFSYNHISNASLGDKNPGANSYMFNFSKNF